MKSFPESTSGALPEWVRIPEACRLTGLSRSTLYELISAQAVKTSALRRRGKRRGVRLVNRASLLALIESHVEEPPEGRKAAH